MEARPRSGYGIAVLAGWAALFLSGTAGAEYMMPPQGPAVYDPYTYYGVPDEDEMEGPQFDDKVFNVGPKHHKQKDSEGHFYGAPNYSREQYKEWIKACNYLKDQSYEKFKKCFQDHVAQNDDNDDR
jgi:hypothetical protein